MAMDRVQMVLVGLPLLLIFTDLLNLFSPPPPPPPKPPHHHLHRHHDPLKPPPQTLDFPPQANQVIGGGIGVGNFVKIDFCSSCSYKSSLSPHLSFY